LTVAGERPSRSAICAIDQAVDFAKVAR